MDQDEALRLLKGGKEGIKEWNRRRSQDEEIPSLAEADVRGVNFGGAKLGAADLRGAHLGGAYLRGADLRAAHLGSANLAGAYLVDADLRGANFRAANLAGANLAGANLGAANLGAANLVEANLVEANLVGANVAGADLRGAKLHGTKFADMDLSEVEGLESVNHAGPSTIGVDTLLQSKGKIPEVFLRGCGVPEALITYLPSILGSMSPIQFYSCFISYSTKDEEFAKRLHARMIQEGLRVWYSPENTRAGRKLHEEIDEAIRVYDKLLLILSPYSMESEWVRTEIRKARKAETKEGRRKLFPIRLVSFDVIRDWECFDADIGKDLGVEIREYFIPDFANWKDHDLFEAGFAKLLRDLKACS